MIIDTDKVSGWAKTHAKICIPMATGLLSWYAAVRWQAAIDHKETALMVFYFAVSATSGITTAVLTIIHFINTGFL